MSNKALSPTTLIAVAVTILSWSSSFVFIRFCLSSYSPGVLALFRYLIVSAVMLIFYLRLQKRTKPTLRQFVQLFFLGFFGIGCYMIALNYGEITVSASVTSFIIGLNPIISMLWAMLFFGEKISIKRWMGVAVSVIGLAVIAIVKFQHGTELSGVVILLLAVLCAGIYNVAQKPLLNHFHAIEVAAISAWIGTLVMLVFTHGLIHQVPHANWRATGSVIYLGVIPGAVGYVAWSYAVSAAKSASKLSLVLYVLPLFSTLLGWLMLGEVPLALELVGGCVCMLGALVATRY